MKGEREGEDEVFFFKQKTAYEMLRSLVGSEMCIRDSLDTSKSKVLKSAEAFTLALALSLDGLAIGFGSGLVGVNYIPVSYTHLTLPTTPYV
ncbi:hypothetical protein CDFC105_30470 [Clostridioides difficile]|nr:hypothetical protein CDFC105_30470 [Clostridioides difficile]